MGTGRALRVVDTAANGVINVDGQPRNLAAAVGQPQPANTAATSSDSATGVAGDYTKGCVPRRDAGNGVA